MASQAKILISSRFWPFFTAQFLGAVNDNLMKAAMVVMFAYGLWDLSTLSPEFLVTLAAGVFILPFVLFSPFAGVIADHFDKTQVIRLTKIAEIMIVILAIISLYNTSLLFVFLTLFLLGTQSAFFTPCKYSILPQHLKHEELLAGNGLLSTGTYIAILTGTILGTLCAPMEMGREMVSVMLVVFALLGWAASLKMGAAPAEKDQPFQVRELQGAIMDALKYLKIMPHGVVPAILSISWFYFVAGTFHAQFANFARFILGVDHIVLSIFMILFSCGIALGGLLNNMLLRSRVDAKLVPLAGALICLFSLDLYWACRGFPFSEGGLTGWGAFLRTDQGWRIVLDLLGISLAGGLFIVPLRALIQERTEFSMRARVAGISAFSDAVFILASSLAAMVLLWAGVSVIGIFALCGLATLAVSFVLFINKPLKQVWVDFNGQGKAE